MTTGAAIGRNFDQKLLETSGKVDEDDLLDALEEAEKAQLVSSTTSGRDVRYTFAHELIRQTLIENLSLPRRQRLHLRIAGALEELHGGAPDKVASTLAHHFYQAGAAADDYTTLRYLMLAADHAQQSAAFEDALEHLERALSFEEDLGTRQRADLLARRGRACRSLGCPDETLRDWRAAVDAYEGQNAGAELARVCCDAAFIMSYQSRPEDALELCERGLAEAGDLSPAWRPPRGSSGTWRTPTFRPRSASPRRSRTRSPSRRSAAPGPGCCCSGVLLATKKERTTCWKRRSPSTASSACRSTWRWPGK